MKTAKNHLIGPQSTIFKYMLQINFYPFPVFTTQRLFLRPLESGDDKEMLILRSNKEVMKYAPTPLANSIKDVSLMIREMNALTEMNEGITWGISMKEKNKLIGTIAFVSIEKENYRAEIGYMLHPDYHGKGIMQEAFEIIVMYGFQILEFHSITATVNAKNKASIKLLEKNNFAKEAHFKENQFYNGAFHDTVVYSILTTKNQPSI